MNLSPEGLVKRKKPFLSAILIGAVLLSGLPFFSPEDVNRDKRVNLEDVILSVKDFSQTVNQPELFTSKVEQVVSTLYVVAGLKRDIKPANDTQASGAQLWVSLPYVIPSFNLVTPPDISSNFIEKPTHYQSIIMSPPSPPPKTV